VFTLIYSKIKIWEENYHGNVRGNAVLTTYLQENSIDIDLNRKRPTILICPGGGYEYVSDRENEPVAIKFLAEGFNVFTLKYDVAPSSQHPQPLLDVSRAMWIIRENSQKWNVDKDRIAVCGFSAGGHLAGSLGVLWSEEYISKLSGMPEGINRPNAMILCYPVITSGLYAHKSSFDNLMGTNNSSYEPNMLSLEKRVNQNTPPTFIWHTYDDNIVPVENSLLFATALRESGIPFDLHIYNSGLHGLSLCSAETANAPVYINPYVSSWFGLCTQWLKTLFNIK
jgi:acetyl esterase/lipase